jgi:type IX secretion system PorP/SprF family membrane protein
MPILKKVKMKTKNILCLLVILSGLSLSATAQQDVQFSQYVFNPLFINTAYAGYRGDTYVSAIYRSQWASVEGSPKTLAASVDWLAGHSDQMGLSARIMTDKLGPQRGTSITGGYTYRIPMADDRSKMLSLGIGIGIKQYSLDGNTFKYVDGNDQLIPAGNESRIVPDADFGIYYNTPSYYISASVQDLISSRTISSKYALNGQTYASMERSTHLYLGAGTILDLSDDVKLKPSFLWKEDFKGPSNIDLNAFLLLSDRLWIGASYRTGMRLWSKADNLEGLEKKDAIAAIIDIYATDKLRIGYSYDFTISAMNPYEKGTHEISIGLLFPKKDKRALSPRYF